MRAGGGGQEYLQQPENYKMFYQILFRYFPAAFPTNYTNFCSTHFHADGRRENFDQKSNKEKYEIIIMGHKLPIERNNVNVLRKRNKYFLMLLGERGEAGGLFLNFYLRIIYTHAPPAKCKVLSYKPATKGVYLFRFGETQQTVLLS